MTQCWDIITKEYLKFRPQYCLSLTRPLIRLLASIPSSPCSLQEPPFWRWHFVMPDDCKKWERVCFSPINAAQSLPSPLPHTPLSSAPFPTPPFCLGVQTETGSQSPLFVLVIVPHVVIYWWASQDKSVSLLLIRSLWCSNNLFPPSSVIHTVIWSSDSVLHIFYRIALNLSVNIFRIICLCINISIPDFTIVFLLLISFGMTIT